MKDKFVNCIFIVHVYTCYYYREARHVNEVNKIDLNL